MTVEGASAVVVDSPIPQDNPGPSGDQAGTMLPAETETAAETATEADPLQELADSVGLDRQQLEAFKDVDTARSEISDYLTERYKRGLELSTSVQQSGDGSPPSNTPPRDEQGRFAPQTPAAPAAIDFASVGLSADDPAAKVIQQLANQLQESNARLGRVEQQFTETTKRSQEAERARLATEVEQSIDSWGSADFGSARSQTVFQQSARSAIKRIAGGLMRAEIQDHGRQVSDLGLLLRQARYIFETSKTPRKETLPASPGGATIPDSRTNLSQPSSAAVQPGAYNRRMATDPAFLQKLRNRS